MFANANDGGDQLNNSALRTVEILECLANSKKPMRISELSRVLSIPKSSIFDIVHILLEKGFLEKDNEELKTFKLGLRIFQIGSAYINKIDLYKIAHPMLERLKNETNETVYLAVEDKGHIVYLDKVESDSPIRSICSIGSSNVMHLTGLGKAILAGYPEEKVKEITGGGELEVRTPRSIGDYKSLLIHLETIRDIGYAIDNGEDTEMVYCMAAPVYDRMDKVIAAISVSLLASKLTEEKRQQISELVVKTALGISNRLGYSGDKLYM